MKRKTVVVTLALSLVSAVSILLAACGAPLSAAEKPVDVTAGAVTQVAAQTSLPALTHSNQTRLDEQGMVEVMIQPINLSSPGETLDFDVSMNTHSVDLSMDLTSLATLTTDTGKTAQALKWDAPAGGHHVSGKLSFPAKVDGSLLLAGAKQLTLVIKDVAAPARTFVWELGG